MVRLAIATQATLLLGSLVLTALIVSRVPKYGSFLRARKRCHLNSGDSAHNEDTCVNNWCVNESTWPAEGLRNADLSKRGYDPVYNRKYLKSVDFMDSSSYKLVIAAILLLCGAVVIQIGCHLHSFCKPSRQTKNTSPFSVTHIATTWVSLVASMILLSVGEVASHEAWGLYRISPAIWIAACAMICAAVVACIATLFFSPRTKVTLPIVVEKHSGALSTDSESSLVKVESVWDVIFARAEKIQLGANPYPESNKLENGIQRPYLLYKPFLAGEERQSPVGGGFHEAVRTAIKRQSVDNDGKAADSDIKSVDRSDLRGGREAQSVRRFSSDELLTATSGDAARNFLGMGGCGTVYKGCLPDGTLVAVKKLNPGLGSKKSVEGLKQLAVEVETISGIHHRNLVRLVGFSISSTQEVALAYEFMENGSLDDHLRGKRGTGLDWHTRKHIAIGAARGLAYLHSDCSPRIVHRDVKAQNLLLDIDFNAKVADFGLARMLGAKADHWSTKVMGTYGYLAPDVVHTGHVTDKTDVYSFGVVLLELLTGRKPLAPVSPLTDRPISLVEWAHDQCQSKVDPTSLVDPTLRDFLPNEVEAMWTIANECTHYNPQRRPTMDKVLRRLQECLERFPEDRSRAPSELDNPHSMVDLHTIAFGALSTDKVDQLLNETNESLGSKSSTTTKSS